MDNGKKAQVFNLRMPPELHAKAKDAAWWGKVSLNTFILEAVERELADRTPGLPPGVDKEEAVV